MLTSTSLFARAFHHFLGEPRVFMVNWKPRRHIYCGNYWKLYEISAKCHGLSLAILIRLHTHMRNRGGLERDGKRMANFKECLGRCGLFDMGYVGQHFTWCNRRFSILPTHSLKHLTSYYLF